MKNKNPESIRNENYPIFYCEKYASKPDNDDEDVLKLNQFEDDPNIREVLRDLESKIIGKRILFSEIKPDNPSVKKWINSLIENYPNLQQDTVEDLINTFRDALYSRSKEKNRIIVGFFQLRDMILLIHSKKDPAIAEWDGNVNSVKLILHPKNILRVAIIKKEEGLYYFSAYEYSRKFSRGHAEFWGIKFDDILWDSLGSIVLNIQLEDFDLPVQIAIDTEELDQMIVIGSISPSGKIRIGRSEGKIVSVDVFRKRMDFNDFYDFYITQKEKLEEHRKKFNELIQPGILESYDTSIKGKYRYRDDEETVNEITATGESEIHRKIHPQYTICFFTNEYPRIIPSRKLITKLYDSIFNNSHFSIWHAGEDTSQTACKIGSLDVYNICNISRQLHGLSESLLNSMSDVAGKKERYLLQYHFCELWSNNLQNKHLSSLFKFLIEDRIIPDLKFEFKNDALFAREENLEFKSASDFNHKITKFVNQTLLSTIDQYIDNGQLTRHCILYGVEDDTTINPILHLKNDMIPKIEQIANPSLEEKGIKLKAFPIPVQNGFILLILLIPIIKSNGG